MGVNDEPRRSGTRRSYRLQPRARDPVVGEDVEMMINDCYPLARYEHTVQSAVCGAVLGIAVGVLIVITAEVISDIRRVRRYSRRLPPAPKHWPTVDDVHRALYSRPQPADENPPNWSTWDAFSAGRRIN